MSTIIHLGQLRRMWFAEKPLFLNHLLRLDEESRRSRFGRIVSDEYIRSYVSKMDDSVHIVHGFFKEGKMCAAGELVKLGDTWSVAAEAAFSVDKIYQDAGIGTELMNRVIRSARNRNVHRLHITCLADNAKMLHIASKINAEVQVADGEIMAELTPSTPTYFSILEEALDDGNGVVQAVLDMQHRYMKAA